jgi:endonuclease YncB( thermonuclease family)
MLLLGHSVTARLRRWTALITALALAACTSMQPVPIEAGRAPEGVAPGDTVTVTTVRGEKLEFEVVRLEPDALVGQETRVAFEDIATLEVEKPAPVKTVGLIAGSVVTTIIVVVGAFALVLAAGLTATGG